MRPLCNHGENLDILAPWGYSLDITSLNNNNNNNNNKYFLFDDNDFLIGTSFSAPIVSASIALLLEQNPNLTRLEIENILKNNASKIGNIPYDN